MACFHLNFNLQLIWPYLTASSPNPTFLQPVSVFCGPTAYCALQLLLRAGEDLKDDSAESEASSNDCSVNPDRHFCAVRQAPAFPINDLHRSGIVCFSLDFRHSSTWSLSSETAYSFKAVLPLLPKQEAYHFLCFEPSCSPVRLLSLIGLLG